MQVEAVIVVAAAAAAMAGTPAAPRLAVVVHPQRAVHLSRDDVARIFLKQRQFWEDGQPIVPLNREPGSAARARFADAVLGRDGDALAAHWNAQYFHGVFPPTALSSAAAVKRYVATDRNAVGYLEAGDVDDTVHVALWVTPPP
jgi:ABC-type phosphate transport system substrate-binding protein